MKKLILLALFVAAASAAFAQTTGRTVPAGWHCVRSTIGGCFSYIVGSTCTEYIYHIEICCGPGSWGTGYQVCHTTTWTTVNPAYRLHSGAPVVLNEKATLEELVKRFAGENGVKTEDVTTFRVTDSEPFEGTGGEWLIVEPNTYKIDKSVAGWALTGINLVTYKKQ